MPLSFGKLFGDSDQRGTGDTADAKDVKISIEDVVTEVDIKKFARHIIRRIYMKNLEGLKHEIGKINEKIIDDVLQVNFDRVRIKSENETQKYIQVDQTVLSYAMEKGTLDICKYLIEEVVNNYEIFRNIEIDTYSPIHSAAINEDPDVFKMLYHAKTQIIDDVNIHTKHGNTPLHFACRYGKPANVKALLDIEEVRYDAANHDGEYPIHWAAYGGHLDTVKLIYHCYEKVDIEKHSEMLKIERTNVIMNWNSLIITEINKNKIDTVDENILKKAEVELLNIIDDEVQRRVADSDKKVTNAQVDDALRSELRQKVEEEIHTKVNNEARRRVEVKINTKFGEGCLKLEGKSCGVPMLCAALKVESGKLDDPHFQCIVFILHHQMDADSTCRDNDCDTALHFLSRKASPEQLEIVLKANALLGVKNEVGNVPLDWITKETMERLLDNHLQKIEIKATRSDFSTKDMYKVLFTNLFGHHASGSDIKNILALAQSNIHQDLALHPVCQSILSVKWQKMWKYFVIKLLFFIPFVVLLSVYPTMQHELQIANDTDTKEELQQQLEITWHVLYFLLMIQVIFGTLSVLVLVSPFWKESRVYLSHVNTKRILRVLEFYWNEFLWSDWYEYVLWFLGFLLLHDQISPLPVVIFSWFSLFLVCSNHPTILPFRYILSKILFNYLKFFIFAFGLISGFAMGFYMVLKDCKDEDGKDCVDGAFTSIATTALKIPSMMMGEIDFQSFSLKDNDLYVYILFGSFIFLITCCLFNMMNALAINITDEMMKKAHIFKTIAECDMTYEFEILLTEVSVWLKWFGLPKVNFLSPVWIERLRASPNSGKCQNLDQVDLNRDLNSIIPDDQWEPRSPNPTKWYWNDRGYELDRKIIYNANSLIVAEFEKDEDQRRKNVIYIEPGGDDISDDENDDNETKTNLLGSGNNLNIPMVILNDNDGLQTQNLLQVPQRDDDSASEDESEVTNDASSKLLKK